jgi:hypothetical protein
MRRVSGVILVGLGAFFIALALLVRFYVAGQLVKYPLDEYQVSTLQGSNVTYFSATKLKDLTVNVAVTDTIRGDVAAGNGQHAVWNEFTDTRDATNGVEIQPSTRRVAFDRSSGQIIGCCGNQVNGDTSVNQKGLAFFWPFNSQKKTYTIFDTTANKPLPISFAGTDTIDGLAVYRYVENVTGEPAGSQTLPGNLVGMKGQPSVTLPEYYQGTNTYWVEPTTGTPVKLTQSRQLTLRDSSGNTRLLLFQGNLDMSPSTQADIASKAKQAKTKLATLNTTAPLAGLLVGVVLIVIGLVLAVTGRERPFDEGIFDDTLAPEPAPYQ